MAVKLRLMRKGSTHRPFFHLVAIDSRKKRKFLELIGIYGHGELRVDEAAANRWLAVGAQASIKVRRLMKRAAAKAAEAPTPAATAAVTPAPVAASADAAS